MSQMGRSIASSEMEITYPAKVFWMCAQCVGPKEHGDIQETGTIPGKGEMSILGGGNGMHQGWRCEQKCNVFGPGIIV